MTNTPDDKLAVADSSALAQRMDPRVRTAAAPTVEDLLQARARISSDAGSVQALFARALMEDLDDEWLVTELAQVLGQRESAQYLVDEYRQLGEGVHLVSPETGRVVITLSEEDLWQPSPVPRESGQLATPLTQIRPDLGAFITTWTFDRAFEKKVVVELAKRGHQTELLAWEGDPRLLVATRAGRQRIVRALGQLQPEALLRACGGTSAALLKCFELVADQPDQTAFVQASISSQSALNTHDQTTVNLQHNESARLQGVLTQGWVREVARHLVDLTSQGASELALRDITQAILRQAEVWVAPPEAMVWLRRADSRAAIVPVQGIQHLLGVRSGAGVLVVPETFAIRGRELSDRWETATKLDYAIRVNTTAVTSYKLSGMEFQGHVV